MTRLRAILLGIRGWCCNVRRRWRRVWTSNRFPYTLAAVILATALVLQIYEQWLDYQIRQRLEGFGFLQRVALFPASWKTKESKPYLEPLEPITAIYLYGRKVEHEYGEVTSDDLKLLWQLPFLKTVSATSPLVDNAWPWVGTLRQIKSLGLGRVPIQGFAQMARCQNLRELSFRIEQPLPPSAIAELAKLSRLKKLRVEFALSYSLSGPDKRFLSEMLSAIAALPTVEQFESETLHDNLLLGLCEPRSDGQVPFTNLKELRLSGCRIGNDGLKNLRHLPSLVHLDLSQSAVTDEGLALLKELPNLRTIYFARCHGISDAGMDALADLSGLESVNLADTSVTPAGLLKLKKLKRLRVLRVAYYYNHDVLAELRRELPATCRIVNR